MANYSTLKAAVADVVKTNGTRAITGANLQSVLLSIINSIGGGGYIFKGVATPSTDAGTPDENVFYIGGAGTYANFGTSVTVPVGSICVFKYNGSWTKEQIKMFEGIDDVPTVGSDNLVKSGGVDYAISGCEFVQKIEINGIVNDTIPVTTDRGVKLDGYLLKAGVRYCIYLSIDSSFSYPIYNRLDYSNGATSEQINITAGNTYNYKWLAPANDVVVSLYSWHNDSTASTPINMNCNIRVLEYIDKEVEKVPQLSTQSYNTSLNKTDGKIDFSIYVKKEIVTDFRYKSDSFNLIAGKTYTVTASITDSPAPTGTFYNYIKKLADNTTLLDVSMSNITTKTGTITVNVDTAVYVTSYTAGDNPANISIKLETESELEAQSREFSELSISEDRIKDDYVWVSVVNRQPVIINSAINSDGTFDTTSELHRTPFLNIGMGIKISANTVTNPFRFTYALYASDKTTCLGTGRGTGGQTEEFTFTPKDGYYVVFNVAYASSYSYKYLVSKNLNLSLVGKKYFALGSSSTHNYPVYYSDGNGFSKAYPEWIGLWNGMEVHNLGVSGATLIEDASASANIYTYANNVDADADVVSIMIGGNDPFRDTITFVDNGSMTDFVSAYRYLIEQLTLKCPQATKILIVPYCPDYLSVDDSTHHLGPRYDNVVKTIYDMGDMYSLPVCNPGANCINGIFGNVHQGLTYVKPTDYSAEAISAMAAALAYDSGHLNAAGQEKMALYINKFFQ